MIGRAFHADSAEAVVKAHNSFDYGKLMTGRVKIKQLLRLLFAREKYIQIV